MSTRIETAGSMPDAVKWLGAGVLLCAGLVGFYYFSGESTLLRVIGLLVAVAVSLAIAAQTERGRESLVFMRDSRTELRKVVWPTRAETTQTTLIVMAVVAVVAMMMWFMDTVLGWLIRLLLGHGG